MLHEIFVLSEKGSATRLLLRTRWCRVVRWLRSRKKDRLSRWNQHLPQNIRKHNQYLVIFSTHTGQTNEPRISRITRMKEKKSVKSASSVVNTGIFNFCHKNIFESDSVGFSLIWSERIHGLPLKHWRRGVIESRILALCPGEWKRERATKMSALGA